MTACIFFCSGTTVLNSVFCARHRRLNRNKAISRSQELEKNELCVRCGMRPPRKGVKSCSPCIIYWAAAMKKVREERRAKGLCVRCGRKAQVGGRCPRCKRLRTRNTKRLGMFYSRAQGMQRASWGTEPISVRELAKVLEFLWIKQKGRCALSNRKLNRLNSHVDHIKATSAGGLTVKNNLRWLHKHVNQAKRALTDRQFKKLCRQVVENS
jgi:hypothetical protein